MKISCVNLCNEIQNDPDIIVFPERADPREVYLAVKQYKRAIVIAAVVRGKNACWGEIYNSGLVHQNYWKVKDDGLTSGSHDPFQKPPIFESAQICVGILVCLDIQLSLMRPCPENDPPIWRSADNIKASNAPLKLLCVPAAWKDPDDGPVRDPLSEQFIGLNMLFFNSPEGTIKSFVSNTAGRHVTRVPPDQAFHFDLCDHIYL